MGDCQLASYEVKVVQALLSSLAIRDGETAAHSTRVAEFALTIAREYGGLSNTQLNDLRLGAVLHDIGKIGIDDSILRKPGKLTWGEGEEMRKHPYLGWTLLEGIDFLEGARRIVLQHHERFDGLGYPFNLAGDDIDLLARIVSVADTFDAITSTRYYRPAKSYIAAAAEIDKYSGGQFDPNVVVAFLRVPSAEWDLIRLMHRPAAMERKAA